MNRSVSIERTYKLGDYRFLKVSDSVDDIPEELATDNDFMNTLYNLQLVEIEKAHYEYVMLELGLKESQNSDASRYMVLQELTDNAYKKLLELYDNYKKEN